jgi:exonuclease III
MQRVTLIQLHTIKPLIYKDNYMIGITTYLSILTLNVNGLNSPIKRHQLTNWIKKEDPTICCLQESHLTDRNKNCLRVKGWKIYQDNDPWKQAGIAILINLHWSNKINKDTHTNKRGNAPKGNNNYQPVGTQCQFHQTYSEGPKNIHKL